ncbi:HAD family hydrolase [Romboutsia sp.]|uniref:HAD family hydrolase n=1 Tax=Romboutsia sp. TaxID=1965302 RepID=UPI003F2E9B45
MIKLIASDMDGTLLDSNKKINSEFISILKKLKSKGIVFAAVSGRDMISLRHVFKDIDEDIIFASNNGNFITYKGEVLFENYIEKEKIEKIAKIVRRNSKHITIYSGKNTIYSESIMPAIFGRKWGLKINVIKDITKIEDKILKVTCFGKGKNVLKNFKALEVLKDEVMLTPSGTYCFDICKHGGTKKQGIKILQEKFNVDYQETMVFGDHLNDLEMMSSAYYSYAMENAKEEVKNKARFIAKTNDENGVIEAIKENLFREKATI